MNAVVDAALALWGFDGASYRLIAARENAVFKVVTGDDTYALRLHRKGYRTDAELSSELDWMDAVARGGISVPRPIPSASGQMLHGIDGTQVDVLSWLPGIPLAEYPLQRTPNDRLAAFYQMGQTMARLHDVSDAWSPPEGFTRRAWDCDGLLGDAALWGQFWETPTLSPADQALFARVREVAMRALSEAEATFDYGLIHADMVPENLLIDGLNLHLIDFDDGGYGFRLFEVATALLKHRDQADYGVLEASLLSGYRSVRPLNTDMLDLFLLLRSASYVGWIASRMDECDADARAHRFTATTRHLAETYLGKRHA